MTGVAPSRRPVLLTRTVTLMVRAARAAPAADGGRAAVEGMAMSLNVKLVYERPQAKGKSGESGVPVTHGHMIVSVLVTTQSRASVSVCVSMLMPRPVHTIAIGEVSAGRHRRVSLEPGRSWRVDVAGMPLPSLTQLAGRVGIPIQEVGDGAAPFFTRPPCRQDSADTAQPRGLADADAAAATLAFKRHRPPVDQHCHHLGAETRGVDHRGKELQLTPFRLQRHPIAYLCV